MMIEVLKFWHSDLLFTVTIQKQPVDVFCKKGFLKNFVKLTEKHLWQSLFLNKLQAWGLQIYLKKDSDTGIFKNTFFIEHVCFWQYPIQNFNCQQWTFIIVSIAYFLFGDEIRYYFSLGMSYIFVYHNNYNLNAWWTISPSL